MAISRLIVKKRTWGVKQCTEGTCTKEKKNNLEMTVENELSGGSKGNILNLSNYKLQDELNVPELCFGSEIKVLKLNLNHPVQPKKRKKKNMWETSSLVYF